MSDKQVIETFIIDCARCKAKVAAIQSGVANRRVTDEDGEPFGERVYVGNCPRCRQILVGHADQTGFPGYNSEDEEWSDVVRVFPKPAKAFSSTRIPRVVKDSLGEADRSMQVGAYIAACVMLGRALEAMCRNLLDPQATKKIMLAEGIRKLKEQNLIDDRLYDWSQQLHAFRNLAAHPEDVSISREDTEDLQIFVNAIVEYVYDLTDRYEEFKERAERRERKKKKAE